jgi:hypothetical protein
MCRPEQPPPIRHSRHTSARASATARCAALATSVPLTRLLTTPTPALSRGAGVVRWRLPDLRMRACILAKGTRLPVPAEARMRGAPSIAGGGARVEGVSTAMCCVVSAFCDIDQSWRWKTFAYHSGVVAKH